MLSEDMPHIDTPDAYQPFVEIPPEERLVDGKDLIEKRKLYVPSQEDQLELESDILGISSDTDPDRFVVAHNMLLADMQADLDTGLPIVKEGVIERTATYFAGQDIATRKQIVELLTNRLAATKRVLVHDDLFSPMEDDGQFGRHRQPVLASHELTWQMYLSTDMDDYRDRIHKRLLGHEVMHGMFTSGKHERLPISVRNGLHVTAPRYSTGDPAKDLLLTIVTPHEEYTYGKWINEATLESFRSTIMQDPNIGYQPGVMVLHMLNELSPGLRDRMVVAALDKIGPGSDFAEIEELLGPTAISDVSKLIEKVDSYTDHAAFKDSVSALLPRELQSRGRTILDDQEAKIFKADHHYQEWLLEQKDT